jgi:hypothetical protein
MKLLIKLPIGGFDPDEFLSKATRNVNFLPPCSFVEEEVRYARVFDVSALGVFDPGQTVTIESVDYVIWNNYPRSKSVTINIYTFDPGTSTPCIPDTIFNCFNSITYPYPESWTLVNHPIHAAFSSDAVVLVECVALSPAISVDFLSLCDDGDPGDIETGDTYVTGCESIGLFTD